MVSYAFRAGVGGDIERSSPLAKPLPYHSLTPAAEQAREAVRRFAHDRAIRRAVASLVTDHGAPAVVPYLVPEMRTTKKGKRKPTGALIPAPRPGAAELMAKRARARGFTVNVFETPGRVRTVVEGFKDPHAFRCTWLRGSAESGTWHERQWRYALVNDARPVGVDKTARVGLKGKRGAGLDSTHLAIVASPVGVSVGVTEVAKRVSTA